MPPGHDDKGGADPHDSEEGAPAHQILDIVGTEKSRADPGGQ